MNRRWRTRRQRHHSNRDLRSPFALMGDETRNEQAVREEAAHQRRRHQTALRQDRDVAPPRSAVPYLVSWERLDLQGASERRNVKHLLQVGLLLEPRSLTPSELRVDQYELWADGLGLHGRLRR
jgi:hypothetical protein